MAVKTYGSALGADFRMLVHHATAKGSEYELEYKGKSYLVRVPLIGKFNMYNSLAALAAVICAGHPGTGRHREPPEHSAGSRQTAIVHPPRRRPDLH